MSSVFSKMFTGEIPCHEIARTDDFLAFLDIYPVQKGHTLVIPRVETDYIFDLEQDMFIGLHLFSRLVAKAIKDIIPCHKVGMAVVGLEVPHTHIHLIPINEIEDMNFSNPRLVLQDSEFLKIAQDIRYCMQTYL